MTDGGKRRTRKGRRAGARDTEALARLQPGEAAWVLRTLLERHPALTPEAEQLARSMIAEVDTDALAAEVENAVLALDIEELNGRAGRTRWGYVEPGEAAWELLAEAIEPFQQDLRRLIDLGDEAAAAGTCQGIVLGLYRCRDKNPDDVLGWAPDFPAENAWEAVAMLARESAAQHGRAWRLPAAFAGQVPEWASLLEGAAEADGPPRDGMTG